MGHHGRRFRELMALVLGTNRASEPRWRLFPNLRVLELEDRRVLSGLPALGASAAGELVIDSAQAAELVNQLNSGDVSLSADTIIIESAVDAGGNATIGTSLELHASTIRFADGANLVTNEGNLVLDGNLVLNDGADVLLSTGEAAGGDISILGDTKGNDGPGHEEISLLSGTGAIAITGKVGDEVAIESLTVIQSGSFVMVGAELAGSLEVTSSGSVTLGGTVVADGGVTVAGAGTTLTADIISEGAPIVIDGGLRLASSSRITLDTTSAGAVSGSDVRVGPIMGGGGDLVIAAGEGDITLDGSLDNVHSLVLNSRGITYINAPIGSQAPVSSLTTDAEGSTHIHADVTTIGGTQTYNDPLVLTNHTTLIDAGPTGIVFNSTVDGDGSTPWNLTLLASIGDIRFGDSVGFTSPLGVITIAGADDVTAEGAIVAAGLFQSAGLGTTTFRGDVATNTAAGINLTTTSLVLEGSTLNATGGVYLNSPVTVAGDVAIRTAGADILINGPIDGESGGAEENLSLISHSGTIMVTGAVGAVVPLGQLSLQDDQPESTGAVVFLSSVYAGSLMTVNQPYTVDLLGGGRIAGAVEFLNTGGVALGDSMEDELVFGQGVVSTAGGTLVGGTIQAVTQDIRLGTVRVLADTQLVTVDGNVRFTGPVDSEVQQSNSLVISAGLGTVEFSGNVGSQWPLNHLVVNSAGQVIVGSDAAPVQVLKANGGIDLGAASAIDQGIRLNGGEGSVLAISTMGGIVHLSGAVELSSDVAIDTTGAGIAPAGADILINGSIDGESGGAEENLSLVSHSGTIMVTGAVGAVVPLGQLSLQDDRSESTGAMVFLSSVYAGSLMTVSQPYTVDLLGGGRIAGAVEFLNTGGAALGDGVEDELVFGQGVVSTAGGTLVGGTIQALAQDIRLGTVRVIADTQLVTADGNVSFTGPVDSEVQESNSLAITAGLGTVEFNGSLGAQSPLNGLSVESSGTINMAANVVRALGDIALVSSGDVTIREVSPGSSTLTGRTFTVTAGGLLTIDNGAALGSDTGLVSNAPPILRLDPDDPNHILVRSDRVQTVTGTFGGNESLGDSLERGANFTLTIVWGDLVTTVIAGIHAGDRVQISVDEAGNGTPTITHLSDTGPVEFSASRNYPLAYLAAVSGSVRATVIVSNDPGVILDDVRTVNLNQTSGVATVRVRVGGATLEDLTRRSEAPPAYLLSPPIQMSDGGAAPFETRVVPLQEEPTRYDELRPPDTKSAESARTWYIARVLRSGQEGQRYPIPDEIASDPARLFAALKQLGLPNGQYRIYLEELGFPRRLVHEFYKSGDSFGDPVREHGPGSSPLEEIQPAPSDDGNGRTSAPQLRTEVDTPGRPQPALTAIWLPKRDALSSDPGSESDEGWSPSERPDGDWGRIGSWGKEVRPATLGSEMTPAGGWAVHHAVAAAAMALGGRRLCGEPLTWANRVDEALEGCRDGAFSLGARLRRMLKG